MNVFLSFNTTNEIILSQQEYFKKNKRCLFSSLIFDSVLRNLMIRIDDLSYNFLFVSYSLLIACGLFQNLSIIISCIRLPSHLHK